MDRASIVQQNDAGRERLKALIARLGENDYRRRLNNGWTVGAMLAHLAHWDRRYVTGLESWERGIAPENVDANAINDSLSDQWNAMSARDIASETLAAAEAIDQKVASLTSEMIETVQAAGHTRWLVRAMHRNEHLDEIGQALAR